MVVVVEGVVLAVGVVVDKVGRTLVVVPVVVVVLFEPEATTPTPTAPAAAAAVPIATVDPMPLARAVVMNAISNWCKPAGLRPPR